MPYDHPDKVVKRFLSTLPKWRAMELREILTLPGIMDSLPETPQQRFLALFTLLGETTSRPNYERAQEARRRWKMRNKQ